MEQKFGVQPIRIQTLTEYTHGKQESAKANFLELTTEDTFMHTTCKLAKNYGTFSLDLAVLMLTMMDTHSTNPLQQPTANFMSPLDMHIIHHYSKGQKCT